MTEKEIKKQYTDICSNLAFRRLKPAFDKIGKLISDHGLGVYSDEIQNLEDTYHYMLKYTVEGTKDPERQKIYRKLLVSSFELADKINEALLLKYSHSVVYERKRMYKNEQLPGIKIQAVEIGGFYAEEEMLGNEEERHAAAEENLRKVRDLFYQVWFTDKLLTVDVEALTELLASNGILLPYKSFLVTAIMLSLQRYFDPEKFMLLFEAYDTDEPEISQRSLVGLLINLYRYDARLQFFPEITGRLKILNENPEFTQNLERVIIQLIRSKETEKLQRRIRDELLPEMIKISPTLKEKINLDSLMEEGLSEDKNPDWEEIFKDSPGLMDKMQEFSELQMEGADVFMGSFAMLKAFPFYSEMGNWFIPFFPENPEIAEVIGTDKTNAQLLDALSKAPVLCNSDKYSFCFSIQSLPKENREFMAQGVRAEMDQLEELGNDDELTQPGRKAGFISNQFVQDLYRFYKLFPRKKDFEDIFEWQFDFHNRHSLGEILKDDPKVLRNIAEFYFAKNYFDEAAEIFGMLLDQEKNGELYQKLAYCYQKKGDFGKALDGYLKAEFYDINRLWNLKKIALCYRNLKQPDKALEYYQEAEKIDSENLNNQLNIGHCLLELDEFEKALKCYFKVEYLAPGNKKVWRPIAWCSFLTGKKEQAEKYFQRLIDDGPGKHDLMNMGHVQWSLGNRQKALEFYRESITRGGFSETGFLEVFDEDLPLLVTRGINNEDVPIMLDQLRYLLEE